MRAAAIFVALKRCTLFTQLNTNIRIQPPIAFRSFTDLAQARIGYEAETVEQIRSRVFGTRIGNGLRSGAKLLRRKLVGHKVANYYLKPIAKNDPMFVDMRAEAKKSKLEKLKRRGKAPPKKGEGKRAGSKKK